MNRKGIILAGGSGTRLWPVTIGVSKQLLPVYDKPMIYYPLSVLMLAGIRDIIVITTPEDQEQYRRLLSDGSQWGISLSFCIQPFPGGLAQAYLVAEELLSGSPSAMILGDNIFFGHSFPRLLAAAVGRRSATVFAYHVADPSRYGVLRLDANGEVAEIVEKPAQPPSHFAVTGLYFLDGDAPERAARLHPSNRGELEITDLLNTYLEERRLSVEFMGRGHAWLDTGTHESLLEASNFVRTLQTRQGYFIGCPEEIAYRNGWIDRTSLLRTAEKLSKTHYGIYLVKLLSEE